MSRTGRKTADEGPVAAPTHTLMLRVVDDDPEPLPMKSDEDDEETPRVHLFDRVRLFTQRLALFRLQTAPVASNGLQMA